MQPYTDRRRDPSTCSGSGNRSVLVRGALGVALAPLFLAGCVTTEWEETAGSVETGSVVIPIVGIGGAQNPLGAYYESVAHLLFDAVLDRDPGRLRQLCNAHDRASAPQWARDQISRYRRVASVLDAELWFENEVELAIRPTLDADTGTVTHHVPALGEGVPMVLEVPGGAALGVRLEGGSSDRAARFHVVIDIADRGCLGGTVERRFNHVLSPAEAFEVGADRFAIPFDLDALSPAGVVRVVRARVEWLPGNVWVEGEALPNQRVICAEQTFEFYPLGAEKIRQAPLQTMRNALRSGEPRHLDNLYLAARFMTDSDRDAALELMVEQVRLGDRVRARACMASLSVLTDAAISVDDREGWLRWWNARQQDSRSTTRHR